MTFSAGDPSEALFGTPIDLPGGGTFSIEGFLDTLDKAVDDLLAQGGRAQHALAVGSGEATVGVVTVRVNAAGQLTAVGFSAALEDTSPASLNRHFMQALNQATRAANQKLAANLGGEVGTLIASQAPADISDPRPGAPAERPDMVEAPGTDQPPPMQMPKDPVMDDWFAMLDDIDPANLAEGLDKMLKAAPFDVPDLTGKTGPEIDAEFAAENQRISDNVMRMRSELETIEVTLTDKQVDITVNASGVITAVAFHQAAKSLSPADLADDLLRTWATASAEANAQVNRLLTSGGIDPDDPSRALLTPPSATAILDEADPRP